MDSFLKNTKDILFRVKTWECKWPRNSHSDHFHTFLCYDLNFEHEILTSTNWLTVLLKTSGPIHSLVFHLTFLRSVTITRWAGRRGPPCTGAGRTACRGGWRRARGSGSRARPRWGAGASEWRGRGGCRTGRAAPWRRRSWSSGRRRRAPAAWRSSTAVCQGHWKHLNYSSPHRICLFLSRRTFCSRDTGQSMFQLSSFRSGARGQRTGICKRWTLKTIFFWHFMTNYNPYPWSAALRISGISGNSFRVSTLQTNRRGVLSVSGLKKVKIRLGLSFLYSGWRRQKRRGRRRRRGPSNSDGGPNCSSHLFLPQCLIPPSQGSSLLTN